MNKFKVGDRVRLVKVENEDFQEYKNYLGKIFKIVQILHPESSYAYAELEGTSIIPYLKNLELVKDEYTYEDLKKSPIGTKVTFENEGILVKTTEKRLESRLNVMNIENLKNLKDDYYGKIIKIEEPIYQTVYEHKEEILDEAEKRYLRGVIRPFRDRVKYIQKFTFSTGKAKITIKTEKDNDTWHVSLPLFEKDSMYKNMKPDKEYTLEELGL